MRHPKALILHAEDWMGLFINGNLIDEGHSLGEGTGVIKYLKEKSKKFNFKIEDVRDGFVTDEYEEVLYDKGCFDSNLNDIQYEIKD